MLQHTIDIGGTILAWSVVLLRLNEALKDDRVRKAWNFALAFALFGTFQVDSVYLAFDALVGLNNLAWLVSYLFGVLSIYCAGAVCCNRMPPWARTGLAIALVLLTATFPLGPLRAPDSAYHVIPHNVWELVFTQTCYVYGALTIGLISMRATGQAYRNEGELILRLRSLAVLSAEAAILAFFALKSATCLLTFAVPLLRPYAHGANTIASIPVLLLAVSWPVSFAPNRVYVWPTRLVRFSDKLLTLMRLRALRDRLGATRPSNPGWIDQLRDLDFYVCQEVINILDEVRIRAASDLPEDDPALNLALRLRRALQGASSSDPATAYWELSQRLRRAA